jgi:hypothetical protein
MTRPVHATRGAAHEGTATWAQPRPAVLVVALRRKARPHQRDVICSTWDCDQHGDQYGDQQCDGYGATSDRRSHGAITAG